MILTLNSQLSTNNMVIIPKKWPWLAALATLMGLLPLVIHNNYYLLVLNIIALHAILVLGLNLLIGFVGQISLGHAAFFGLGAYFSAILTSTYGWLPWPALLMALMVTGLVAFLIGIPVLRLEGHYLVMATLGFNIIISIFITQMEEVTGGPSGFSGIPPLALGSWAINTDLRFYYLIWPWYLLLLALSLNLVDSRVGRALRAIHENELTANALGVNTERYKIYTFVLSALFASLAGSLYAHYLSFISPKSFDIFISVQLVAMVVIGGMTNLWGGLLGAALLTILPELLHVVRDYNVLVYGLILMIGLVFFPEGLLSVVYKSSKVQTPPPSPLPSIQTFGMNPAGKEGE